MDNKIPSVVFLYFKMKFISVMESYIFSIAPVFSVTWSFRNHIWLRHNYLKIWNQMVQKNLNIEKNLEVGID